MRDHRPPVRPEPAFPIRLLALDIDGTLVGPDTRLSPRIRAVIAEAVERGVRVSLATGRRPVSAVGFANQLNLSEPIISHQGAVIRAMPRRREAVTGEEVSQRGRVGRLLYHKQLAPDVIRDAIAWCLGHGLDAHVNDLEEILAAADDPRFEDYSAYYGRDATFVPDLAAAVNRPMTKVISSGEPPAPMRLIGEARRLFAGRASPTVSHPRFLEFVAPGVSKGHAVAWLAHRAGIPLGQVLTIGDALNDQEMIADAGHGAAMISSPIELWPSARYLAAPVEEDGAAALIEALVLAPPREAVRNATHLAEAAREIRRDRLGPDAADRAPALSARTGVSPRTRVSPRRPRILPDGDAARAEAVGLLRAGGIVAVPTDTVYGIAADMALPDAIERLFAAKRRPPEKAVAVLLADAAQAADLGVVGPAARVLGERFWPGGLTLVLPVRPGARLPRVLAGGAPTIGVRVPDHPAPRALAAVLGPLPTTSANVSGEPDARDAQEIAARMGGALALVIDGGPIHGGPASTVVDCTGERPVIRRVGAIPADEIVRVLAEAGLELVAGE